MWGGGGSKMATQAVPPTPSWRNYPQNRRNCRFSPHEWAVDDAKCPPMVREVSAKCPPRSHVTSVVRGEKI